MKPFIVTPLPESYRAHIIWNVQHLLQTNPEYVAEVFRACWAHIVRAGLGNWPEVTHYFFNDKP